MIKNNPGHKADIKAKAKTYIPMVLDYLECKIGLRDETKEDLQKIEEEAPKVRRFWAQFRPNKLGWRAWDWRISLI
jgi:hypothetical protein